MRLDKRRADGYTVEEIIVFSLQGNVNQYVVFRADKRRPRTAKAFTKRHEDSEKAVASLN